MTALRTIRENARLTGAELARRAGIWSGTYWQWEQGKQLPRAWSKLCRLADVLQVSVDSILGRAPLPAPPPDAIAVRDRKLLDSMERFARALLGRDGGGLNWRSIATAAFQGRLFAIRDILIGQHPTLREPPKGWFDGWESPRQRARRLNRPEPKRLKAAG